MAYNPSPAPVRRSMRQSNNLIFNTGYDLKDLCKIDLKCNLKF